MEILHPYKPLRGHSQVRASIPQDAVVLLFGYRKQMLPLTELMQRCGWRIITNWEGNDKKNSQKPRVFVNLPLRVVQTELSSFVRSFKDAKVVSILSGDLDPAIQAALSFLVQELNLPLDNRKPGAPVNDHLDAIHRSFLEPVKRRATA